MLFRKYKIIIQIYIPQVIATFIGNIHLIDLGLAMAMPSIIIPALTGISNQSNRNEFLSIGASEASWISKSLDSSDLNFNWLFMRLNFDWNSMEFFESKISQTSNFYHFSERFNRLFSPSGRFFDGGIFVWWETWNSLTETSLNSFECVFVVRPISGYPLTWCILFIQRPDILGRKKLLILANIPFVIGWFLLSQAGTVCDVYIGLVFLGVSNGLVENTVRITIYYIFQQFGIRANWLCVRKKSQKSG